MHAQQRKEAHDQQQQQQQQQQHGDVSFALFLLRCSSVCKAWRKAIDAQVSW
jgi:hypothetical protein